MVPPPWKSVACCELSPVLRDSASVYLTQEDAVVQLLPRGGIKFTTATVGFLSLSLQKEVDWLAFTERASKVTSCVPNK